MPVFEDRSFVERVVRRLLRPSFGRASAQGLYEGLHRITLEALHYGPAGTPAKSGEVWLLERLADFYDGTPVTVLDVGANVGGYAAEVVRVLPDAHVIAVEPSSAAFAVR